MTDEEKKKFKEHIKDFTKTQILSWMSAITFIVLFDEVTEKLRAEFFEMFNICVDVIKEEKYNKGCVVKAEKVRQGHWIKEIIPIPLSDTGKECVRCSECNLHYDVESVYCPNCGAKMESEVES